ncbi:Receptor-like serine/threonine-protein kinase ALE2 [Linum perenne]
MRTVVLLLLCLLRLVSDCLGNSLFNVYLTPLQITRPLHTKGIWVEEQASSTSKSVPFGWFQFQPSQRHRFKPPSHRPSLAPAPAPAPFPQHKASSRPRIAPSPRRRGHHRHRHPKPAVIPPSPSDAPRCDQICVDPLTATPYASPCGCVFPMKVRLLLNAAPYTIFPSMRELELEVATGTYLEQSQVKIMGATADSQNQGETIVDVNLVPLGEKFDNTTATLIYQRFWHKRVPLNTTVFGNYEVVYIVYPGIPSSPPYPSSTANSPSVSTGDLPFTVNPVTKSKGMNFRTLLIIALSVFVFLVVLVGAILIFIKWKKFGKPSNAVGPTFPSSINKRSGLGSFLSGSIASSTSMSLMSNMAPCMLSVKTFTYVELDKATEKFSSKRILGVGGFGCVYHGIMEDRTEVAVKVLTRDNQNGDREFIAEVEMLSRLHHRNLVKLIGICIEGRTRCLVYELVHNGSVESHLHERTGFLDWDARLKIALGSARGLAYLHEDSNPRVIHRDFKGSNILLEDDFTPKVSDFGLAKEATEGSHHISTRVMGTFGYVAPEYAMTVLLELLSGRKPVDMSQPQGQENLVTWARPLLTTREGLEQLVDPSLAGSYDFDDMAKVAAIASMCVHPEVTNRPFMGEVVQALKLIYNDMDETGADNYSQREESSALESDFKGGDFVTSDSSWWNAGAISPHLTYGQASPFITMEYSSGPLDDMENRPVSASSLLGETFSSPVRHGNRSGPLRMIRSKPSFYRFRGSMSDHGGDHHRPGRRSAGNDEYWV